MVDPAVVMQHNTTAKRLREAIASAPAARSACVVVKDTNDRECHFWVDELPASRPSRG